MEPRSQTVPLALVLGGGSLLQQVSRELRTAVDGELAPFDITAQQAALLLHAAREAAKPNQLAPLIGTDTAGMTRLLDRLEGKGLIERRRHPDDRRSIVVEVTEAGRAIVPHLPPVFGRVTSRLLYGFSAEEIRQLTGMLQRMLDNLGD